MTATVSTMEEVQEGWRRRWSDNGPSPRPSCFNRADYIGWLPGCPHWKTGGNARVTKMNVSLPWAACNGCKQKGMA